MLSTNVMRVIDTALLFVADFLPPRLPPAACYSILFRSRPPARPSQRKMLGLAAHGAARSGSCPGEPTAAQPAIASQQGERCRWKACLG